VSTLLIAFHGRKRSGKDTAAKVVRQWGDNRGLVVERRGFADLMKLSMARSMGLATNMNDAIVIIDELKEFGDVTITIPSLSIQRVLTGREFCKYFGTEGHRDVFGQDFWLDFVLPVHPEWASNFSRPIDYNNAIIPDIALITDLRFANEAKRVHELGGQVIEIHRPLDNESENHSSEQGIPRELIDYTIENDSTLEAFETEVNSWMTAEHHMRFVPQPDYE
jgi:hypothetical protein